MKDTSKAAFPAMDMNSHMGIDRMELRHFGMTLLEYYVAHAPAEPQFWFQPVMITKAPKKVSKDSPDHEINEARYWEEEKEKQRIIQWPLAWAREQIRQLENDFSEEEKPTLDIKTIIGQRDQAWKDDKEIRQIIGADENESTVDEVRRLLHKIGGENLGTASTQTDIKSFSELVNTLLNDGIIIRVEVVDGEPRLYSNLEGKYFDVGGYVKEFGESEKLHRID